MDFLCGPHRARLVVPVVVRPRRYPIALWIALLAVTAGAGYGIQDGLFRLQEWIGDVVIERLGASGARTDPYQSRTDLGHIGTLKLDDAIVLRVRIEAGLKTPLLLHRATYNGYFGRTWSARNAPLAPRESAAAALWVLARDAGPAAIVKVFDHAQRGNPVLSCPAVLRSCAVSKRTASRSMDSARYRRTARRVTSRT